MHIPQSVINATDIRFMNTANGSLEYFNQNYFWQRFSDNSFFSKFHFESRLCVCTKQDLPLNTRAIGCFYDVKNVISVLSRGIF